MLLFDRLDGTRNDPSLSLSSIAVDAELASHGYGPHIGFMVRWVDARITQTRNGDKPLLNEFNHSDEVSNNPDLMDFINSMPTDEDEVAA